MAARHARGELAIGQDFVHESLLGTTFTGRLTGQTQIGPYQAVLPSLSGRGWITGYNTYVLADDDPFLRGYTIADLWGTESTDAPEPSTLSPNMTLARNPAGLPAGDIALGYRSPNK